MPARDKRKRASPKATLSPHSDQDKSAMSLDMCFPLDYAPNPKTKTTWTGLCGQTGQGVARSDRTSHYLPTLRDRGEAVLGGPITHRSPVRIWLPQQKSKKGYRYEISCRNLSDCKRNTFFVVLRKRRICESSLLASVDVCDYPHRHKIR